MKTRVLLIDDCPNISQMLQAIVERYFAKDVQLTVSSALEDGIRAMKSNAPDIVLLDYCLAPYRDCSATIPSIRAAGFKGPIHLWSSHDGRTIALNPAAEDADGFFQKQDFVGIKLRKLVRDHFCGGRRRRYVDENTHQHALEAGNYL